MAMQLTQMIDKLQKIYEACGDMPVHTPDCEDVIDSKNALSLDDVNVADLTRVQDFDRVERGNVLLVGKIHE